MIENIELEELQERTTLLYERLKVGWTKLAYGGSLKCDAVAHSGGIKCLCLLKSQLSERRLCAVSWAVERTPKT